MYKCTPFPAKNQQKLRSKAKTDRPALREKGRPLRLARAFRPVFPKEKAAHTPPSLLIAAAAAFAAERVLTFIVPPVAADARAHMAAVTRTRAAAAGRLRARGCLCAARRPIRAAAARRRAAGAAEQKQTQKTHDSLSPFVCLRSLSSTIIRKRTAFCDGGRKIAYAAGIGLPSSSYFAIFFLRRQGMAK